MEPQGKATDEEMEKFEKAKKMAAQQAKDTAPEQRKAVGLERSGAPDWVPDENGNLVAQAGDNVHTLAEYQGISISEAQQQLDNNGICNVNECDVVNTGSYNLPTVNIKASRTNYQSSVDNVLDKGDFVSGSAALTSGSFRLSTTKQGFSPRYYGNSWSGNQYATTFNIGKIGNAAGGAFFVAGTANDIYGVYNYYQNSSVENTNAVHPGKAGLNLGMAAYGAYVNPIPALLYGGLEAFYPGGSSGAMKNFSENVEANRKIIPNYHPVRPY